MWPRAANARGAIDRTVGPAVTAIAVASKFLGLEEIQGPKNNPLIQWAFSLCEFGLDTPDSVPWCSAFAQIPSFVLGLPRSKSAAARSWLKVGTPVELKDALRGNDVVVLGRGSNPAQGHVGFFAGFAAEAGKVLILGGNQSDQVSIDVFAADRIVGIRRLA